MGYSFANDRYKPIAHQLVQKFNMHHINLDTICFISNDSGNPRDYAATIRKFNPPYDLFIDYNFFIVLYDKKMQLLNENQVKAVIYHMLLSIDGDGESIRKPDVTDFSTILRLLGPHWLVNPDIPDLFEIQNVEANSTAITPVVEPVPSDDESTSAPEDLLDNI